MSQAKVDRYKESKKNRKQEVKKAKQRRMLAKLFGCIITVAIICWIGFSGYSYIQSHKPAAKTEVSMQALNDYLNTLSEDADNSGS